MSAEKKPTSPGALWAQKVLDTSALHYTLGLIGKPDPLFTKPDPLPNPKPEDHHANSARRARQRLDYLSGAGLFDQPDELTLVTQPDGDACTMGCYVTLYPRPMYSPASRRTVTMPTMPGTGAIWWPDAVAALGSMDGARLELYAATPARLWRISAGYGQWPVWKTGPLYDTTSPGIAAELACALAPGAALAQLEKWEKANTDAFWVVPEDLFGRIEIVFSGEDLPGYPGILDAPPVGVWTAPIGPNLSFHVPAGIDRMLRGPAATTFGDAQAWAATILGKVSTKPGWMPMAQTNKGLVDRLAHAIPALRTTVMECPALSCKDAFAELGQVDLRVLDVLVIHLNDFHRWRREAIADWLETLPVDLSVIEK